MSTSAVHLAVVLAAITALTGCKTRTQDSAVKALPAGEGGDALAAAEPGDAWPFPLEHGEKPFVDADGHDEDYWVEELLRTTDATVQNTKTEDRNGVARRAAHAKPHGCVLGRFVIAPDRPQQSRFGLFKDEGPADGYPVWIRFSNAMPKVQSDLVPDGRGMAMKIIAGGDEPRLLPGQEGSNAVDFAFVTGPVFPTRNVKEYFELQQNLIGFLASHPRAALIAKEVAKNGSQLKTSSPLLATYWSMGAQKLGPQAVKYSTRPCTSSWFNFSLPKFGEGYLRDAMVKHLMTAKRDACFEFGVQFQTNAETMPVEDPTVEWRESTTLFSAGERLVTGVDPISRFVKIAEIRIPPQVFTNEGPVANSPQDKFCERLSFNPWRTTDAHRPLGNLMRARLKVYKRSLAERSRLNHTTGIERNLTGTPADVSQ